MNGHIKVVLLPVPEKFNTFNTFNTFDRVAAFHRTETSGDSETARRQVEKRTQHP